MADNILLKVVNNMSFPKPSLCKFMCLNVQLMRHIWLFYPILLIILSFTITISNSCVFIFISCCQTLLIFGFCTSI